jgi:hypothetical protein
MASGRSASNADCLSIQPGNRGSEGDQLQGRDVPCPMQVANYIFGNNEGGKDGEKIAMTSPVGIEEDFRSMKGGKGEKIAMTSPVSTAMDGTKYAAA